MLHKTMVQCHHMSTSPPSFYPPARIPIGRSSSSVVRPFHCVPQVGPAASDANSLRKLDLSHQMPTHCASWTCRIRCQLKSVVAYHARPMQPKLHGRFSINKNTNRAADCQPRYFCNTGVAIFFGNIDNRALGEPTTALATLCEFAQPGKRKQKQPQNLY